MDSLKSIFMAGLIVGLSLTAAGGGTELPSAPTDARELLGQWKFTDVIIERKRQARPNPNLNMVYALNPDGLSQLEWRRTGEKSFCMRRGTWSYQDGKLIDSVEWLSPDNTLECAQDPDMRLGITTHTPVSLVDGEINMELTVGEQKITYIWQRLSRPEFP